MYRYLTLLLLLLVPLCQTGADELKPAYAELDEYEKNQWHVTFKVSERSILGQIGQLKLPPYCVESDQAITRRDRGNLIRTSSIICSEDLWGQSIGILGLEKTNTDALLRISSLSGQQTLRLTSNQPSTELLKPSAERISNVAYVYTELGFEHILQGYDHLLFVIAMVLLISGIQRIAWTITAFTIAHSITLIGTTMGYLSLPPRPVEAVIALSIVFLALELVKRKEGQRRLSESYPWLIAFTFGLLHGFGFAGALAEIGLPKTEVPLALLTFNLGVELGQLVIVGLTLSILLLVRRLGPKSLDQFKLCCAYCIGITSTYWLLARVVIVN